MACSSRSYSMERITLRRVCASPGLAARLAAGDDSGLARRLAGGDSSGFLFLRGDSSGVLFLRGDSSGVLFLRGGLSAAFLEAGCASCTQWSKRSSIVRCGNISRTATSPLAVLPPRRSYWFSA